MPLTYRLPKLTNIAILCYDLPQFIYSYDSVVMELQTLDTIKQWNVYAQIWCFFTFFHLFFVLS